MYAQLRRLIPYLENLGTVDGMRFLLGKRTGAMSSFKFKGIAHPVELRPKTSDEAVFAQIFVKKEYDIRFDFTPQVVIDGGANIGCFSVYMKNRFPDTTIIAIEPDPSNFESLRKNTRNYSNVYLKQVGLWSRNTRAKTVDKFGLGNWGLVTEEVPSDQAGSGDIVMATIDDLMNEFNLSHIDILKLDIESAEKQLFTENYMSWLPKVRLILIELHDWMTPGCSRPFFAAINEAFPRYTFSQVGENSIIANLEFDLKSIREKNI